MENLVIYCETYIYGLLLYLELLSGIVEILSGIFQQWCEFAAAAFDGFYAVYFPT